MFAEAAARMAGLCAHVLGWRPDEFWGATPTDVATCLAPFAAPHAAAADGGTLARLKELFPDG